MEKKILFILAIQLLTVSALDYNDIIKYLLNTADNVQSFLGRGKFNDAPKNYQTYDFIVVGGGSSGSVVANRLSENPNWSVFLIEAGGVESIVEETPLLQAFLSGTSANWGYETVPQKNGCFGLNNNILAQPRGKLLGGTSSINNMIYTRGNKHDFDMWAAAGNPGWTYEEILPYFLKSEDAHLEGLEDSPYHNKSGPLSVQYVDFRTEIAKAFVDGAQEAGYDHVDYNGASQIGVSYVQSTTKQGRRASTFEAFLKPIRKERENLHIVTSAQVTRVLIDSNTKKAYGVELFYKNKYFNILASKEVILSAGVFNSAQLLMLSGVGPAENLNAIGIPVIKDLPVGKQLFDHISHFGPTFITNTTKQTLYSTNIGLKDLIKYAAGSSETLLSSIGAEVLAFGKANNTEFPANVPDYEFITIPGSLASDGGAGLADGANIKTEVYETVFEPLYKKKQDHYSTLMMLFHPKSVGRVWLNSSDPFQPPVIDPNYFSDPEDVEVLLQAIKESIRISKTPALQKIGAQLHDIPVPGCENFIFASDDYWRCSIRTLSYSIHHQVATCRMGAIDDPTTVVNNELKVHGIENLRVVDASVIPFPPTSHTNAMAIMIGEKGADMIRDTHMQ